MNSDCAESDDGPLALDFLSFRFLSASQILFASNWEALLLTGQRHWFDPEQPVPRTQLSVGILKSLSEALRMSL